MSDRHGLNKHLRTRAKVTALRPPVTDRGPGVLALADLTAAPVPDGVDVAVPGTATTAVRPTGTAPAAKASRPALFAAPTVDDRGRVQVTAVARALGWVAGEQVPGVVDPDEGLATFGNTTVAAPRRAVGARLDAQGRLALSPAVRAALGVGPGSQIVAAGDPETGSVVLRSAGAALTALQLESRTHSPSSPDETTSSDGTANTTNLKEIIQ